jgi:hypothetical protein
VPFSYGWSGQNDPQNGFVLFWALFQVESVLSVGRLLFKQNNKVPMVEWSKWTVCLLHCVRFHCQLDANLPGNDTLSLSVSLLVTLA